MRSYFREFFAFVLEKGILAIIVFSSEILMALTFVVGTILGAFFA